MDCLTYFILVLVSKRRLTGRSNSYLRKIKRFIRANELYFGHNGTASSGSFFLHRAASILPRVEGFRSGRCRGRLQAGAERGVKVRDGAVVKTHLANLSLTIFAKWKQTEAFTKKGCCEKMQFFGRKMVRSKGLEPSPRVPANKQQNLSVKNQYRTPLTSLNGVTIV